MQSNVLLIIFAFIILVNFYIRNLQTVKALPDITLNKGAMKSPSFKGFKDFFKNGFYLTLKLS